MLTVVSLGAGVQSTTMVLMAARGVIGPMPDCAIFADTGEEPRATYDHLVWLTGCELVTVTLPDGRRRTYAKAGTWQGGVLPFPTHIAQAWSGHGKPSIKKPLGDEILDAASGRPKAGSEGATSRGMHSRPPFFVRNLDGSGGIIRRQCTGDYKIDVIQSKERELLGLKPRQRWPREILIEQWIGISTDEATRMKPVMQRKKKGAAKPEFVPHCSIRAAWPLIDAGMSRAGCEAWLVDHGYKVPPKSACTFCPFHSNAEWRNIRDTDPDGWQRSIQLDRAIRTGLTQKTLVGELYLHASRTPLEDVDLSEKKEPQLNLFESECEGACGL